MGKVKRFHADNIGGGCNFGFSKFLFPLTETNLKKGMSFSHLNKFM